MTTQSPNSSNSSRSVNSSSSANSSSSVHLKPVRLNKYISDSGYCSRREADKLIEQGRVTINGQIPEMGTKVLENDEVCVDNKPVLNKARNNEKPIYIALNKPTGITCTTERDVEGNIIDFIGHKKRIFPIGRLDKPSDGLIFLTNDGDIVNKILRAGNAHEKEYVVRVNKPISDEFINNMASGVEILDTVTLPCKVSKETEFAFRITLTQGLNRQIRRMCEALGYEVFKLRRVRIMNITIDGIPNGEWRYLTDEEMSEMNRMMSGSIGTEEASKTQADGQTITKATDAKLYDARLQAQREVERERENEHGNNRTSRSDVKTSDLKTSDLKTYRGKGEFQRRPNQGGKSNTDSRSTHSNNNRGRTNDRSDSKPSNQNKIKKWTPRG